MGCQGVDATPDRPQVHRLTLATRNVADFERCGAALCNPWEE